MKIRTIKLDQNDVILEIRESFPVKTRKDGRLDGQTERFVRQLIKDLEEKDKSDKIFIERVTDEGKWF
jgi:hypothetical protein